MKKKYRIENKGSLGSLAIFTMVMLIIILLVLSLSITVINAGERGVRLTFGSPSEYALNEGLHFKIPLAQRIIKIEVKTQKYEAKGSAASRDLQTVNTDVALNFRLIDSEVPQLYQQIGLSYISRVVEPAVQETLKSVTAQFTAEELITRRAEVRMQIEEVLKERLQNRFIIVESVSITDFQFSKAFDDAIEQKVTAEQLKLKAERDLERIQIEAQQAEAQAIGRMRAEVARADGQAQAIAIIENQLRDSPNYIEYYKIDKWDGVLPKVVSEGSAPLIQIN